MAETAGFMTDLPQSSYLSLTMRRAISAARQRSHRYVTLEHLLLALLDDPDALQIMEAVRADIPAMRAVAVETVNRNLATLYAPGEFDLRPSYKVERVLQTASDDAHRVGCIEVDAAFVVSAISRETDSPAAEIVRTHGFKYTNSMTWLYTNRGRPRGMTATLPPQAAPGRSEPVRPVEKLEAEPEDQNEEAAFEQSADDGADLDDEFELEILDEGHPTPGKQLAGQGPGANDASPNRWSGRGLGPAEKPASHPPHSAAETAEEAEPLTDVAYSPEPSAPPPAVQAPVRVPIPDRSLSRPDMRSHTHPGQSTARDPAYGRQFPPAAPPSAQPPRERGPHPSQPPYPRSPQGPRPAYEGGGEPALDRTRDAESIAAGSAPGMEPQPRSRRRPDGPDMYAPSPPPQQRHAESKLPSTARLDEMRVRPQPGANAPSSSLTAPQSAKKHPAQGGNASAAGAKGRPRRLRAGESKLGKLVENIPRRMRSAIPERIEVRISREETHALTKGMEGRGETVRHDIAVTQAMSVMLRAPNGGFIIETISPETQWVYDRPEGGEGDHYGRWRWIVTPTQLGQRPLQLVVCARTVDRHGNVGETALPDQVIDVRVRINYQRIFQNGLQWIIVMAAGGVISEMIPLAWRAFVQ